MVLASGNWLLPLPASRDAGSGKSGHPGEATGEIQWTAEPSGPHQGARHVRDPPDLSITWQPLVNVTWSRRTARPSPAQILDSQNHVGVVCYTAWMPSTYGRQGAKVLTFPLSPQHAGRVSNMPCPVGSHAGRAMITQCPWSCTEAQMRDPTLGGGNCMKTPSWHSPLACLDASSLGFPEVTSQTLLLGSVSGNPLSLLQNGPNTCPAQAGTGL